MARACLSPDRPVYAGHADIFEASFRWYRDRPRDRDTGLDLIHECNGVTWLRVAAEAGPWIDKERLVKQFQSALGELLDVTSARNS